MKRIYSLIVNFISLPLYWFSFIVPRNNNLWVFGAWFGHRYTDNSKWLFDKVCNEEKQVRAIWLTHERSIVDNVRTQGREAYLINSVRGYWYSCRAGLVVVSTGYVDVNRLAISRAKKINLWHGSPMKKIGFDDRYVHKDLGQASELARNIWRAVFPFVVERWDIIIACSEIFRSRMASAYKVDLEYVKVTGYPRNDILIESDQPSIQVVDKLKARHGATKVILYAPTHRNELDEITLLFDTFSIDKIERALASCGAVMLIKMHYFFREYLTRDNVNENSRIYWLKEEDSPEINPLLIYTDLLITDYSGVYFDFLLLDKPIVFAPFDLQEYLSGNREMYEEYKEVATAGQQCKNWDEVMAACCDVLNGDDRYCEPRKLAQQKYNDFIDADSSKRVINVAKELVGQR